MISWLKLRKKQRALKCKIKFFSFRANKYLNSRLIFSSFPSCAGRRLLFIYRHFFFAIINYAGLFHILLRAVENANYKTLKNRRNCTKPTLPAKNNKLFPVLVWPKTIPEQNRPTKVRHRYQTQTRSSPSPIPHKHTLYVNSFSTK